MKTVNLHHLMYFREIALAGSVSKAAERLNIGQPTLSEQLRLLEETLGQQLFERINRRMVLTEVGKHALKYANDIYQSGTELLETLNNNPPLPCRLKIGVVHSIPKHLVVQLINDAQQTQPSHITITEGNADEMLRELHANTIDILISTFPAPSTQHAELFSRSLAKSQISIYGDKSFLPLINHFPKSLDGQSFILPNQGHKLRNDIEHYFRINNIQHKTFVETHDTSIQKLLCIEGQGLVALPNFSTLDLINEGKLYLIGNMMGVYEEFWMISSKHIKDKPAILKLCNEFNFSLA